LHFYNDKEKKEKIFYDKLLTIFLNDKNQASDVKSYIDKCYLYKITIIDKLNLILNYFSKFFTEKEKNNISEIKNHLEQLTSGSINYYWKNQKELDNLINKYELSAKKINNYSKSILFLNIYNTQKNKFKNSTEKIWIEKTENDFKSLKKIFNNEEFKNLNKQLLKCLLDLINEKNKKEINEEMFYLAKLFSIEISQNKINNIINTLKILLKKEKIYDIALSIFDIINNKNILKGKLWTLVKEIINNSEKLYDENISENIAKIFLKDYRIDINSLNNKKYVGDNYLNILYIMKNKPDAKNYLIGKSETYFLILQDVIRNNNKSLNEKEINSFEKCTKFMKIFENQDIYHNIEDIDFLNLFKKEVNNFKNIELYFTEYANSYERIKTFSENIFDNLNVLKNKIFSICKNSEFILKNEYNNFYDGIYYENGKKFNLELGELNRLNDISKILMKQINNEKEINYLKKFMVNGDAIIQLYEIIKEIYNSGYIEDIEIKINLEDDNLGYIGCNFETNDPEQMILKLQNILNNFNEELNKAYRDKPLIRNIYGRQFNLLYEKIYKNKNVEIYPILMFLSNLSLNNPIEEINYKIDSDKNIFDNIEKYLQDLLSINNINLQQLEGNLIKLNKKKIGVFCYHNKKSDIYKIIINHFQEFCSEFPFARNILICNEETTKEELIAFLYRAFLCQSNCCFLLGGIDNVHLEKNSIFLSLVRKFIKQYEKKMLTCFVLVVDRLENEFLCSTCNKDCCLISSKSKVEIIDARTPGYGKSAHIKFEVERRNRKYIYFPLGGIFTRKELFKRLQELNIDDNITIHLDYIILDHLI